MVPIRIALLPGMDGTGELFIPFLKALPKSIETKVVKYPPRTVKTIDELVEHAVSELSGFEPNVLLAESFSGPISFQLTMGAFRGIKLQILCASFVTNPRPLALGLAARLPLEAIFSLPIPELVLRKFCFEANTEAEVISTFYRARLEVSSSVLAERLRSVAQLPLPHEICQVPTVLLCPRSDYLVPRRHAAVTQRYFRAVEVVDVDGPHFLLQSRAWETAEKVCLLIEKYIRQ